MAFFELRKYEIRPGKMDEWIRFFDEEILPFQVSKGMVVVGSFRGEDDDSVFVWIRRFEDESHRERLYTAVYESDVWKKEMTDRVGELINRETISVTRLVPTSMSTTR